jgi:hypothetical protein
MTIGRTYTDPLQRTGLSLYAKPHPHTAFDSGDEIEPASEAYGSYNFALDPTLQYGVYLQAGSDPASSDQWQFSFDPVTTPAPAVASSSIVVRSTYVAPFNPYFDIRGLVADFDFMDAAYSFSDLLATTQAVNDGPLLAVRDKINGWIAAPDGDSNPTRKSDHVLFPGTGNARLLVSGSGALDVARNRPFFYIFSLVNPAVGVASDVVSIATNGSNDYRGRQYVNISGRVLIQSRGRDGDASQTANTATGQVAGVPMVICSQFLFANGQIKISKNLDTPVTGSLVASANSSDTASIRWAIGGNHVLAAAGSPQAFVLNGPLYRQWYVAPPTALTEDERIDIITELAALKDVAL